MDRASECRAAERKIPPPAQSPMGPGKGFSRSFSKIFFQDPSSRSVLQDPVHQISPQGLSRPNYFSISSFFPRIASQAAQAGQSQ